MSDVTREDGLTDAEGLVADALEESWERFVDLPVQHVDELAEFSTALHALQNLLAIRIARRHYPDGWSNYENGDDQ